MSCISSIRLHSYYFFNQTPQLLFLQSDSTATISSIRLHGYYFFNQTPLLLFLQSDSTATIFSAVCFSVATTEGGV